MQVSRVATPPETYFRQVLHHVADAVVTMDIHRRVTYANPAAERLYGIRAATAEGREISELMGPFVAAGGETLAEITAAVALGGHWEGEIAHQGPDGEDLLIEVAVSLLKSEDGSILGSVSILREISDRRALERLLAHRATHDDLTGLLNRAGFMAALADRLNGEGGSTLLFVDVNGFKAVNDSHGHQRGDAVLQAVAGRLGAVARRSDLVGRLGGDEFVILTDALDDETLAGFLARVASLFTMPVHCRGRATHMIGASIGAARSRPGDDPDALIRRADEAMYEAKRSAETATAYRIAR
jgi:diguanylate cyclase (GGDEF)-like protein/PAS domain S-box-containing protein